MNLHEPFLHRAAESRDAVTHGLALGAFLTLRLVDVFAQAFERTSMGALRHQIRATLEYLADLGLDRGDAPHLENVVRAAHIARARGDRRALWPALLAYTRWLEQELRNAEALDVLETALRLGDEPQGSGELAIYLHRGRVLRKTGQLDEARAAYDDAEELARCLGDPQGRLSSRIGRANVLRDSGKVTDAARVLRSVLDEARRLGDRPLQARAVHELARLYRLRGRAVDAIPLAYRAFELYEHATDRLQALADTGVLLKDLGHHHAAKRAFLLVLEHRPPHEDRVRTTIELIEVNARLRDRVSFERWRRRLSRDRLPGEVLAVYEFVVGMGLAEFGFPGAAARHLERAAGLARRYGLVELGFRVESAHRRLATVDRPGDTPSAAAELEPSPELRPTIARLEALAGGR